MTMDDGIAIALDGFLYDEAVRGDQRETIARFRLILSPTDESVDEWSCPARPPPPRSRPPCCTT
ncbi:hypothetical protein ACFWBB_29790 [Streptomyces sp. NPDC060000]|uniref:hypothetical protein n=1 Tax=Streptomyces sp. NPDC060000 TaxID=3347031 RepID=UPI0036952FE1